jgi:membrane associated rhomboid family serine protease
MTDFRPGRLQALPVIVKNLIIINVIMVLLQFVLIKQGINLQDYLGLHYWSSPLFRWWQPLTHMFMHGDPNDFNATFWHIALNMFALWMFGRILEGVWGPKRFLTFYIICGLGAALCHMGVLTYEYSGFHNDLLKYVQNPTFVEYAQFIKHHGSLKDVPGFNQILTFWSANPDCSDCGSTSIKLLNEYYSHMINEATIGASGAVFGVLFAFGYLFPNTELMLLFPPIPIKAKWFVGLYAIFELVEGIQNSAGDNIAHFAHLGGMLFAFILLRIWNNKLRNRFY